MATRNAPAVVYSVNPERKIFVTHDNFPVPSISTAERKELEQSCPFH